MGPWLLLIPTFDNPSLRAFVCLEGEAISRLMDDKFVAIGAECFLLPQGFWSTIVAPAATFATATSAATLGECCNEFGILFYHHCDLFALLLEF